MSKDVTEEEVRSIVFSMPKNKAPGPDGYPAEFYQKAWPVIGADVVAAINSFFDSNILLKEVNATIVTLVPKKINPLRMGDSDQFLVAIWFTNASPKFWVTGLFRVLMKS